MNGMAEIAKLLEIETDTVEQTNYNRSTYEVISKVAYLIGVPKSIFESPHEPPKMDVYRELERNKSARIIRHLCIIRTAIERNFKSINDRMRTEYRSLISMPEIPRESLAQLEQDGISFIKKSNIKLTDHIIEINRVISDRINNCKPIFPIWLNWQYIRELFIMPDGLREEGTKAAASHYYANLNSYPYQVYICMPNVNNGNILYCDKKFVTLLYEWHYDRFTDFSKVTNIGDGVKENIYDFIEGSGKLVVVVDCENSDPYKLSTAFQQLSGEYTEKISKIILCTLFHRFRSEERWRVG